MFRQIREGMFASQKINLFTIQVYEYSVLFNLLVNSFDEMQRSLSVLIHIYYPFINNQSKGKSEGERDHFIGYYLLYYTCIVNSLMDFMCLYNLTQVKKLVPMDSPQLQSSLKIRNLLETKNYIQFFKEYEGATYYQRIFLDWRLKDFRKECFLVLKKAYYFLELKDFLSLLHFGNNQEEGLQFLKQNGHPQDWIEKKGDYIIIHFRAPKLKV